MRVLFPIGGGRSHLYPVVPLAWALCAAGHEVRLAGTPSLVDAMADTGMPAVTVGGAPRLSPERRQEMLDTAYGQPPWPVDWPAHPEQLDAGKLAYLRVMGLYCMAVADAMAEELVAFARSWRPDVIVYDAVSIFGAVAAAVVGAVGVRYAHGSTHPTMHVENRLPGNEPLPEYAALCERFGLDAVPQPAVLLDALPASMDIGLERAHVELRWIPYNGRSVEPDGLAGARQRPQVCVTWGVTMPRALGSAGAGSFRDTVDAVTDCGADAVLLTSAEEVASLGELPANARPLTGAPLQLVLRHCDAIVHHGGDGSTMTAAALGIPQLAITREPINDRNGGRLTGTGAGIHLRHQDLTGAPGATGAVRDAVCELLTNGSYRAAAARLRDEIEHQPAPAVVAGILTGAPG
jgi:glycosyltransferase